MKWVNGTQYSSSASFYQNLKVPEYIDIDIDIDIDIS